MRILFQCLLIIVLSGNKLHAQDSQSNDSLFEKEINAEGYSFFLTNSENNFYTGSIQIADKYNNTVFYEDSIYTRYNWDTLTDLDNDGKKELILDLGTGANMYDYNMFLIFNFSKDITEPVEIHNAELRINTDEVPKIVSYVRLSPAVMGAGYSFSLRYNKGDLILEDDIRTSKVLKSLEPDGTEDLYLIDEYNEGFDPCAKDSEISVYYEATIIQWKILGQEGKGWKFFDTNYKCKNKTKVRKDLKKIVNETYAYLKDTNNYKFSSNKY